MNKFKNKYPNADIFLLFSVLLFLFWLFCTKLIVKMDDGHFMGILANEDFSLAEWLKNRYETVSGRTMGEALMMTFLKSDIVLWKIFGFLLFEYIIYFLYKLSPEAAEPRKNALISCSAVFLVFIGVLNAGAFWFAGSFTFLVPCTFMLIAVTPALFDVLEVKYHPVQRIIAVPCAVVAASQEQAAVCTCAILICVFIYALIKKKLHITSYLPFPVAVGATIYLLTAPGVTNRGLQQAADSFKEYADFGIIKKLILGFSNYSSYTFFFSVIVTVLFTVLLSAVVCELYENNKNIKKLCVASTASVVFVVSVYNLIHFLIAKQSVDTYMKKAFMNNDLGAGVYITTVLAALIVTLWGVMTILLMKKNQSAGFVTGLFGCASLGCGLIMGFSSSIYASGKRVFFFSEIFMIAACVLLFSKLKPSKFSDVFLRIWVSLSLIFYALDVINFLFMEIPIMN